MATDQTYTKKPEESVADYTKRTQAYIAARNPGTSFGQTSAPIDVSTFNSPAQLSVPELPSAPIPDPALAAISTIQDTPEQTALKTERDALLGDITSTSGKLATKSARKAELEVAGNVPELNKQLHELNSQIRGIQSEALAATEKSENRLAPTFAIRGEQAQIERQRAVRVYGLAAAAEAVQGNIALANDQVARALDAEFGGLEKEIENKKFLLTLNMDNFSTEEKRRAEKTQIALDRQKEQAAIAREEKKGVYDVLKIASSYNAPTAVLNRVLASKTYGEAIAAAEQYLQDPKAKYDLESARLDNILKLAQITKTRKETAQIGQPTAAERKEQEAAEATAKEAVPILSDKISLIDNLLKHSGLNSAVGTTALGRVGIADKFTGAKQDFIAGVSQLVNKETVDTLINLKARGGTLGALSDQERLLLQSAATKIGSWQTFDDSGKVKGYNINTTSFKNELNTIKRLATRALEKAGGATLPAEDKALLNQFFSTGGASTTAFDPSAFFAQ